MAKFPIAILIAVITSSLLAGAAPAQTAGPVEVMNAWARATPGKAENGAAYLTVESPAGDRLTGVSTPIAGKADLHTMTTENGVMKMRPLTAIDLPPGQPVTLKPGGMHIMLMGLKEPLKQGESFPLTLHFAKAGQRQVNVAVEAIGAMGPGQGGARAGSKMPMPMPGMGPGQR